jgi:hypothetical protein
MPTATARTRYTRPPEGHADGAPEGLTRGYEGFRRSEGPLRAREPAAELRVCLSKSLRPVPGDRDVFQSCDQPASALLESLILSGYDRWDRRQLPALDDGNKALNVYHSITSFKLMSARTYASCNIARLLVSLQQAKHISVLGFPRARTMMRRGYRTRSAC